MGLPSPPVRSGAAGWAEAAAALERGEVVAIPTDTVYGLAARVDRPAAIAAVFALKGRPHGLALPVLVGDLAQASALAATWPPMAAELAGQLWPGALTLVMPAPVDVAGRLGSAGPTVGVRCPDHAQVRALCMRTGPLAVTSANRHGQPPCATAAEVVAVLGDGHNPGSASADGLALVVDGGTCAGTPSTVVDVTSDELRCLRAGGVSWEAVLTVARGMGLGEAARSR